MHTISELDPDRQAVIRLADKAARTCSVIKLLLESREDHKARGEFKSLIDEVCLCGLAVHELLANRALLAKSDALEARAALETLREAQHA